MDDVERRKNFRCNEKYFHLGHFSQYSLKILKKFPIFKQIFLAKTSQNSFAYSFVSENSRHFFYFKKKLNFLATVAKNAIFIPAP